MTGRKVASLTSSLLARKGGARPAATGGAPSPALPAAPSDMADAPADPVPPLRPPAPPTAAAQPDLRPYAWPTQGPPSDDDLAVPPLPDSAEAAPSRSVARPGRLRRIAVFGISTAIAAAVVASTVLLVQGDRTRAPSPAATAEPVPTDPVMPAGTATATAERRVDPADDLVTAARAARAVAPAAGTPPGGIDPSPALPRAPATPQTAIPSAPDAAPRAPISAAALAPPPIERTTEPPPPAPPAGTTAAPPPPPPAASPARAVAPTPPPPSATASSPIGYAVQIASVGSRPRAETESARLAQLLHPILDGRTPMVEEAEVAGRGTMYRIRVDGYDSRTAADRACAAIKGKGLGCLVVRR